jgi:hypothetical protein
MAYTVLKLITNAYNLSGIVSRRFQTVSGAQLSTGLDLLNDLLAIKTADNRLIPYYSSYTLTTVAGQETYTIPNLILAETLTFVLQGVVRYPVLQQGRKMFYGSPRVNGIRSLPFNGHIERAKGGATLSLYFLPDAAYPVTVWGKFSLASVTINQDLEATMDRFLIVYLRYLLANAICQDQNKPFLSLEQLEEYEEQLTDLSPPDMSVTKMSTLQTNYFTKIADANFPSAFQAPI